MVYNVRESDEHPELNLAVQASVETDDYRRIIMASQKRVARTMVDVLTDQVTQQVTQQVTERASLANSKNTLIRLLGIRFGEVPTAVKNRVQGTNELEQISGWTDRVVTAKTLKDVGILPRKIFRE